MSEVTALVLLQTLTLSLIAFPAVVCLVLLGLTLRSKLSKKDR